MFCVIVLLNYLLCYYFATKTLSLDALRCNGDFALSTGIVYLVVNVSIYAQIQRNNIFLSIFFSDSADSLD